MIYFIRVDFSDNITHALNVITLALTVIFRHFLQYPYKKSSVMFT